MKYLDKSGNKTEATEIFKKIKIMIGDDLKGYAKEEKLPTKTSQLENDSGFITETEATTYEALPDKPKINGVELSGKKTFEELGNETITNKEIINIIDKYYEEVFK